VRLTVQLTRTKVTLAMTDHEQLVRLLAARSARRGTFTLSSGRQSSLYIDARLTTMTPEGQRLIGRAGLDALRAVAWQPDAVGGLTLGADPIAYAICHTSADTDRPLKAFTVRKEPKTHGAGRQVEGPLSPGDRVVIVEDVITTGASAVRAIEAVQREGAIPLGVLALVDREEGGRDHIEKLGLRVHALVTATEILPHIPTS
jgi:orotate phosphoribosyltransferase